MTGLALDGYDPQSFYCEMLRCAATAVLTERLARLPMRDLAQRAAVAEQALYNYGITFTVYSEASAIDRILPFDAMTLGSGSCRDFALLTIEAVRSLGLAARFVSGYLYSPAKEGDHVGGGATHAWAEIYLPGAGWIEYDPTNGIVGNRDLIRVAIVRDPRQAVPLSGTWTGDPSDLIGMDVEVRVTASGQS